jgi:hypothetical protein
MLEVYNPVRRIFNLHSMFSLVLSVLAAGIVVRATTVERAIDYTSVCEQIEGAISKASAVAYPGALLFHGFHSPFK